MKTLKYLTIVLVVITGITINSCDLPDNIDPKAATDVPVETVFANALVSFVNAVDNSSVNVNVSRLFAQYWTETTYFDEARYNLQDRGIPDSYSSAFYKDVLMDLQEVRNIINETEASGAQAKINANQLAIVEVLEVYSYQVLVDAFGNVPYSEALMGSENSSPKYDDARTIYADLLTRITNAINAFDTSADGFGSADLLFHDDVAMWKKFAASLKARIGIRLADVDATAARNAVESAVAAGVFDEGEGAIFEYLGVVPHVNTIFNHFSVDGRKDWLPANTIVNKMISLDDPRLNDYFTTYNGEYLGATYGLNGAQTYANFSHFADPFFEADFPAIILDYTEVEFILAEAAQRGWNVGGTAEQHYDNAVTSSILYWGGTQEEADAYLAQPEVSYNAANWKMLVGTQKWIALYNRGVEAWAEWRRLDFPVLNIPEGMTYEDIPVRMPYPYDEEELNPEQYEAAVAAMGGDTMQIPIFWDVN